MLLTVFPVMLLRELKVLQNGFGGGLFDDVTEIAQSCKEVI